MGSYTLHGGEEGGVVTLLDEELQLVHLAGNPLRELVVCLSACMHACD